MKSDGDSDGDCEEGIEGTFKDSTNFSMMVGRWREYWSILPLWIKNDKHFNWRVRCKTSVRWLVKIIVWAPDVRPILEMVWFLKRIVGDGMVWEIPSSSFKHDASSETIRAIIKRHCSSDSMSVWKKSGFWNCAQTFLQAFKVCLYCYHFELVPAWT